MYVDDLLKIDGSTEDYNNCQTMGLCFFLTPQCPINYSKVNLKLNTVEFEMA
jgi:hypothetical protein